ncbi:MAG: DNA gyrase subunit A, partial [Erysipelotrichia bacterium]|nr:DNA gyrase subunit A [Erysipelotrichia bacterium]
MKIVIDIRKETDAEMILNYFYKNTDLQISYNYNNVVIVNKRPVQTGLLGLLDAFIEFRKEVVTRRSQYELDRMEARCHIIEGLMKAVSIVDQVIAIIRASRDKSDAKVNLIREFGFDEIQAEAIVTLRLYRLSNTDIIQLREEFAELANKIEEIKSILENANVLRSVIVRELKAVKKEYDDPRRTQLEDEVADITIDRTAMIANERVQVTVSEDGYLKRVSLRSYTASAGTETGLKTGDHLIGSMECDTLDTLLLFTSKGNYAYLPIWQIDDAKWKDIGAHLNKQVRIEGDDKIRAAVLVKNFDTYAWIVTAASNGQVKKTPVDLFPVQRNSRVAPCMLLAPGCELVSASLAYADQQIVYVTKDGYSCRYDAGQIPAMGIKARGVKGINLSKGDVLTDACIAEMDCQAMLYLTAGGAMKRVKIDEIPSVNRPAKGNLICKRIKSNPSVLQTVRSIASYDTLYFYDPEEQILHASEIPLKPTDTSFSSPLVLKSGWYLRKGIEECRIVDRPADEQADELHEDVEKISLFSDDNNSEK